MRALVTGAAGFIGSSIVDRLLQEGVDVVGVDSYTSYYSRETKVENVLSARNYSNFKIVEIDLSTDPLHDLFEGVTHVFHQAGQPGVRNSWGNEFNDYVQWNIIATQRLLEFARHQSDLQAFVAASSSSIYGSTNISPTSEDVVPEPISPYGVTKLAAEKLCTLYGSEYGVPTASLRYFTVFGPRQRPDMAFQRVIESALLHSEFVLNGTGDQVRDFTYVDDVVTANILTARRLSEQKKALPVMNIGGGNSVSLREVLEFIETSVGRKINLVQTSRALGDPMRTSAECLVAEREIGWRPRTELFDGILRQIEWNLGRR